MRVMAVRRAGGPDVFELVDGPEATRAHADMEARGTVGKLLLLPEDAA